LLFYDFVRRQTVLDSAFLAFCSAKIAHGRSGVVPSSQDRVSNWQSKNSATIQRELNGHVMMKLCRAAELENASCHKAEPVAVWKARKYIEEHAGEKLSLREVAKVVNMNANHLSENFKRITGINFVEYIARSRFNTACDLLLNGDLRISDIAFAAGFQSLSQFNRVFKKLSEKSPTEYRV
jgi:AraC-like DNA-binding protein